MKSKQIARNIMAGGGIIVAFLAFFVFKNDQMVSGLMEAAALILVVIAVYLHQQINKEKKHNQNPQQ